MDYIVDCLPVNYIDIIFDKNEMPAVTLFLKREFTRDNFRFLQKKLVEEKGWIKNEINARTYL